MKIISVLVISAFFLACSSGEAQKKYSESTSELDTDMNYWYQGKAELNNYELEQSRYGEIHQGNAVLIFVTEDFNTEKQVKADFSNNNNSTKVLKLNFTKKFNTGLYPYSLMSSTFTPVYGNPNRKTLKVSTSNQDWCGHTFMQLNLRGQNYVMNQFSYFESEADVKENFEADFLEDEIWNLIRLNPSNLPQGEITILPSTQYIRLKHKSNQPVKAEALLKKGEKSNIYQLHYQDRELEIEFENKVPFSILGWTESYKLSDGSIDEKLVTKARLKKKIMLDYWNKNSASDSVYRKQLGLD